jgi:hypothetical protein
MGAMLEQSTDTPCEDGLEVAHARTLLLGRHPFIHDMLEGVACHRHATTQSYESTR